MIEAPFGLFEVEVEGVLGHTLELGQPDLGHAPEAFDAIDVDRATGEFIPRVVDTKVAVAEINKAIVATPSIGVDDGAWVDPTTVIPCSVGLEQSETISV